MSEIIHDRDHIQTVILSKKKFPQLEDAIEWIAKHKFMAEFKGKPVDEKVQSWRFRQQTPLKKKEGYYQSIKLDKKGVTITYQYPHTQ